MKEDMNLESVEKHGNRAILSIKEMANMKKMSFEQRFDKYGDDALLSVKETAEYLNLTPVTLYLWKRRKKGPQLKHTMIGGSIRYKYRDIQDFLKACRKKSDNR